MMSRLAVAILLACLHMANSFGSSTTCVTRSSHRLTSRRRWFEIVGVSSIFIAAPKLTVAAEDRKPLRFCLVNVVRARETARLLEADLMKGSRMEESRGVVKTILKAYDLRENAYQGVRYLSGDRAQNQAKEIGRDAVEYLASVVEFDAFDKIKKDYTSTIAINMMTPEKLDFTIQALHAAVLKLDQYLRFFGSDSIQEAEELYRRYYLPVELQESE